MKKLLTIILLTIISTFVAFAQNSKPEKEVLKLRWEIDEALAKRDIAFFERIYADDYVSYDPNATVKNRAQALENMRKRFEDPTSKNIERTIKSNDV